MWQNGYVQAIIYIYTYLHMYLYYHMLMLTTLGYIMSFLWEIITMNRQLSQLGTTGDSDTQGIHDGIHDDSTYEWVTTGWHYGNPPRLTGQYRPSPERALFVLVVSSPAVSLLKTTFGYIWCIFKSITTPYGVDPSLQLHENTLTY